MNDSDNPEEQIRNINASLTPASYLYFPLQKENVVVRDLGRVWIYKSDYDRGGKNFNSWTKDSSGNSKKMLHDQNDQIPPHLLKGIPKEDRNNILRRRQIIKRSINRKN